MEAGLFYALAILLVLWVAFWVIRLGVRYGMDDALRRNAGWLRPDQRPDVTERQ